jgi:hypothetical protein
MIIGVVAERHLMSERPGHLSQLTVGVVSEVGDEPGARCDPAQEAANAELRVTI